MIRSYFIIAFIFFFLKSYSQSVSINGGYNYYFLSQKNYSEGLGIKQELNYTVGISVTKYFKKSSMEFGYYFGTKNFEFDFTKLYNDVKISEIKSSYHHFPFFFSPRLFKLKRSYFSLSTGLIFIKNNSFRANNIYEDGSIIINDGSNYKFTVGIFAHLGLKYSYHLNQSFVIFSSSYYNYKFALDFKRGNSFHEPPPDRAQVGINFGVEWIFVKNLDYFRKFLVKKNQQKIPLP